MRTLSLPLINEHENEAHGEDHGKDSYLYVVLPDVEDYAKASRDTHLYVLADHLAAYTPSDPAPINNPRCVHYSQLWI